MCMWRISAESSEKVAIKAFRELRERMPDERGRNRCGHSAEQSAQMMFIPVAL